MDLMLVPAGRTDMSIRTQLPLSESPYPGEPGDARIAGPRPAATLRPGPDERKPAMLAGG
ncbi:hypothetical protein GCM10009661_31380 [Catellatospora chokoriensis]|uniref:Uncharacterized protein n=1 Tax=Catellatospora chokoriensis TaxID=310353 RepID=A0A8J3K3S9_9ACTN|nr:hypothetical protein Cch02nite_36240 [Catellatospora chokoriensis]